MYDISIIFIGAYGYERATDFKSYYANTLCLPNKKSPACFDWPIKDHEIYLVDTGNSARSFINHCAVTFFSYGATMVNYISASQRFVIEKGVSHD